MDSRLSTHIAIGMAVTLLGFCASAVAGPPLICHPIDIGQAKTLPWVDWNQKGNGGYDLKSLTRDTLAILDSGPSVLVRMETLRRATLYARQDPQVAKELLTRLHARAASSDSAGRPEAMAWFDIGYLAGTYQQWIGKNEANPALGLDGYSMVKRAIRLRGPDPELEFAAALITFAGTKSDHLEHLQKAVVGAKNDSLLCRNLASIFPPQMTSELRTHSSDGGLGR